MPQEQQQQQQQRRYHQSNGRRAGKRRSRFSMSEQFNMEEVFRSFDTENTGKISCQEVLDTLGIIKADSKEIGKVFPNMDKLIKVLSDIPEDRLVDFDEFMELMESTVRSRPQSSLQEVTTGLFGLFDVDGKGYITKDDLRRIAHDLGEDDVSDEYLDAMMEKAGAKVKGRVTVTEFAEIMDRQLLHQSLSFDGELT